MELKKVQSLSRRVRISGNLGLLLVFVSFCRPVWAQAFLCNATQPSHRELAKLEPSCPIGKGIWGESITPSDNAFYWIQCGLLPKPMSLAKAKPIYAQITTDVWIKPEPNGYRCLIGPYLDSHIAAAELRRVRSVPNYQEAFIRAVKKGSAKAATQTRTKTNTTAARKPTSQSHPESQFEGHDAISVRLTTVIQGKTYVVPYLAEHGNQFYMEHGKPWNRVNYQDASQICRQIGMSLVTYDEFKRLRRSGVMEKHQWPLQLPYWGQGKKGLFEGREANQLNGGSQLNVMCVK